MSDKLEFVILPRGWGKSVKSIRKSLETGKPIVVLNEERKKFVLEKAASMSDDIPQVLTVREMRDKYPTFFPPNNVIVDDGEEIIQQALNEYLRCNVSMIILSKEDEE